MGTNDVEFDITKNIKLIEKLKSDILSSVSSLYESMLKSKGDLGERTDKLADIIIFSYLLANRIGIDNKTLDAKIINKIRASILVENGILNNDAIALLKHIDGFGSSK